MPENRPAVAPPFDQGVFLLHYNRGREAFQEARYAEARRELENAQRLRPDDADVLNLLGLVYFKTNAFPEAEVIYRRLASENPNVFILHSNLGLILFKQGNLDEAERFLLRAVELRPTVAPPPPPPAPPAAKVATPAPPERTTQKMQALKSIPTDDEIRRAAM